MRQKHVPLRTCIACGTKGDKRQFLRIVRTPQGVLEMDSGGRKPGRGAYLCLKASCWEDGIKRKRIENALRSPLSAEERALLTTHVATLPASQD
ncbi:MAG: YlxR family protein [Dehalococcoidia bacterium]|nr:YlxR family protein [Dehalococcoidia bacterium]